ncbi:MAPEG family protein [uncultured Sulfitobacter sp.]|uniref:MAPEG family protein n=1 Tax=uncultured Sulfitobacter sp. TaxID=191468 RepID=UPI002625D3B1|nr:MAPEG family protein [uncultured Sulfitobacter sp.]
MSELDALVGYGLLVMVTLLLQATAKMSQLGVGYLMGSRDEQREVTGMAARLDRALHNSIVALTLFAPAVLLIILTGDKSTGLTQTLALIFIIGRVIYLPSYVFGIKGVRSIAWAAGFFATAALYIAAY